MWTEQVLRIPRALLDLAAGREPAPFALDPELVATATEHRMGGLLYTWACAHAPDGEEKARLAVQDLRQQAHAIRIWKALESCVADLAAVGIEVATIKGVTAEARWYQRRGERPCSDVDLLLAPHQLDRASDAVATLDPRHPWLASLDDLVASTRVQTVTLEVDGLEIDLHFDVLKLGIPTRQAVALWERTCTWELPNGGSVRVLDESAALFHLLVHLNKDRFQRLLGYADVARVIATGAVDWHAVYHLSFEDGIEVPVTCSLEAVLDELGLPWPDDLPRAHGPRAWAWRFLWRRSIRLRGTEGRLRFRMRQSWIAFLARGRIREATRWWLLEWVPPASAVEMRYGHIAGPRWWKLVRGRVDAGFTQRREVATLRRSRRVRARTRGVTASSPGPE